MKKTRLAIILLVLTLLCGIFILVSCGGNEHTHNYSNEWSKDGTYHWQACLGCEETRNKSGHEWNTGIITIPPTETSEGVKTYTCNACGQTRIESVPMLETHEHTFSEAWSYNDTHHWHEATCEHRTEQKDYDEHDWDEGVVTKQPTGTAEGEKTYTCEVCQKTKVASIGKLDHVHTFSSEYSFDDNHHWYAATCGHENEVSEKATHRWDSGDVVSKATVYDEGVMLYTCLDCLHTKEEAIKKIPSFTVVFYDSDNKIISKKNYELNTASSQIVVPIVRAEEGFQFEAWVNVNDAKNIKDIDFGQAQENVVYQFKPTFAKIHKVIFIDYTGEQLGDTFFIKDGNTLATVGLTDLKDLPSIPSREGYEANWDEQILSHKITETKIFIPVYEVITYTVTFLDAKNGNEIATRMVEYGSFALIPTYELYHLDDKLYGFTGWKLATTDEFVKNIDGNKLIKVYSDLTVYAVYEESIEQPVLAVHFEGTAITMSLCMPDKSSLYSISFSVGVTTQKGICSINTASIIDTTSLNANECSDSNTHLHLDKTDWITYNDKSKTLDFVWGCGAGHSFNIDLNLVSISLGLNDGAQMSDVVFTLLENSSVVYGQDNNINNVQRTSLVVWFY